MDINEKLKKIAAEQKSPRLIIEEEEEDYFFEAMDGFHLPKKFSYPSFSQLNGKFGTYFYESREEKKKRADAVFAGIKDFLEEQEEDFFIEPEERFITLDYQMVNCRVLFQIAVLEENECVNIRGVLPIRVQKGCRYNFCKVISKINRCMEFGAFTCDDEDEIMLHYSYSFAGENTFSSDVFDKILGALIFCCDMYYGEKIAKAASCMNRLEIKSFVKEASAVLQLAEKDFKE